MDRQRVFLVVRTAILYAVFSSQGMSFSVLGPSLLDLQRITQTETKVISTIHTWRYLGTLFGAVLSSVCYGAVSHDLVLMADMISYAGLTVALPWWTNFIPMAVNVFVIGLCGGLVSIGTSFAIIHLWEQKSGPYIQGLHLFVMVGAAAGPLIVKPFLSTSILTSQNVTSILYDVTNGTNDSGLEAAGEKWEGDVWADSRIHPAFWITAICMTLTGLAEAVVFLLDGCHWRQRKRQDGMSLRTDDGMEREQIDKMTTVTKRIFLSLAFSLTFCFGALEDGYGMLVFTFLVQYMGWSQDKAAIVNTVFWGSQAVGRAAAVVVSKVLRPQIILLINGSCVLISLCLMIPTVHINELFVWGGTALFALGLSSIIPSVISFANHNFKVEARETSIIFGGIFVGKMTGPALIGVLYQEFHPLWFLYLLLIIAVLMSFIILCVISCRTWTVLKCWKVK